MIGRTLNQYRIEEHLGTGGMGTVYRARDLRLERPVAIKLLDDRAVTDEASRARLLHEARAASALNHPHICTVYEVGEAQGLAFIVMEHVEGRVLSRLVPTDGLPAESVIRYGSQIASALEHAHERGVIHRDLKSGNIIVTPDGRASVLDFGLAARVPGAGQNERTQSAAAIEETGRIAGTLAYLAPEILLEQPASAQSDIWALGVALYEMASGELPFHGRNEFDLTAAILRSPAQPLPAHVPAALRLVIQRCLAKEPARRYRTAGEVQAALEAVQSDEAIALPPLRARPKSTGYRWVAVAAIGVVGVVAAIALLWQTGSDEAPPVGGGRLTLLVSTERLAVDPVLSPDGKMLAYGLEDEQGQWDLYVSRVAGGGRVRLTNDAAREESPQFSPDGELLAFTRRPTGGNAEICVVPALGGAVAPIVQAAAQPAWSPDQKRLAFVHRQSAEEPTVLATTAADGSDLRILYRGDSSYPFLRHPAWSPDGGHIAMVRGSGGVAGEIWFVPADGGAARRAVDDPAGVSSDFPAFTPDGRGLVYSSNRGGATNLWYLPLDGGAPLRLTTGTGPDESPSAAADGSVAFLNSRWRYALVAYDQATGATRPILTRSSLIWAPAFSPDGGTLAFSQGEADGSWHIWVVPAEGGDARQLTAGEQGELYPRFTPDGSAILYHTWSAPRRVWRIPVAGGPATALTAAADPDELFADPSPDGQWMAFVRPEGESERVYVARADGSEARLLTSSAATVPRWSPDSRWIAFSSERGYAGGIFVIRPDGTGERRLTQRGGWPVWWPDGSRLGYLGIGPDGNQQIFVVALEGGPSRPVESLRFEGVNFPFDVSPGGQHLATSSNAHLSDEIWLLQPRR